MNMKRNLLVIAVAMMLFFPCLASAQQKKYEPTWESLKTRPLPAWFQESKFGIFIHWGVYAVPAWEQKPKYSEWYWYALMQGENPLDKYTKKNAGLEIYKSVQDFHNKVYGKDFKYQDFAPMFKAELFNPDEWADVFKRSGAKYVVLTSKHHEGFCLWPSKQSWNWNSFDIGPHRDLLGDLSKSVRKAGLRMGLYYSLYEWFNPIYKTDVDSYVANHMLPQLKDLVINYQPALIFSDGEWDHPSSVWRSTEFLAWLYNEAPNKDEVVVDDRWGKETRAVHGDYYTSEYGGVGGGRKVGIDHAWEENQGMGRSFGYNRNENANNYKTSAELLHMLIDIVSRGGNLLLDVGPTADGRIPELMQQRLLDMGEWLNVNGEAIYETKPWRVQSEGTSIKYTSKPGAVYAISLKWPKKQLVLDSPKPGKDVKVTLLGYSGEVSASVKDGKLVIEVPDLSVDEVPCRHAYTFKLTGVQ